MKLEYHERRYHCVSCDTLKEQLSHKNWECEQLIKQITTKPDAPKVEPPIEITKPRYIPWNARRQMLEAEDRERARALRNAAQPDASSLADKTDTEALERELDIASKTREGEASS